MLRYPRNLRGTELQLLITVLLFFAAGYLLVVAATGAQEVAPERAQQWPIFSGLRCCRSCCFWASRSG